jgi:hypothetical protein
MLATEFIFPVTQEHKLYLEDIEDIDNHFIDDKIENFEYLNSSNQY